MAQFGTKHCAANNKQGIYMRLFTLRALAGMEALL